MKVKQKINNQWSKTVTVGVIVITALSSQAGSQYSIQKHVIAGGGIPVKANQYVLKGAIGQKITTRSTSMSYQVTAGFYQENRDLIFFNEFESNQ